jgi:hypothetical protein
MSIPAGCGLLCWVLNPSLLLLLLAVEVYIVGHCDVYIQLSSAAAVTAVMLL